MQDTLLACIEGLARLRDVDAFRPYLRGVAWRRLVRTRELSQRLAPEADVDDVTAVGFDEDRYDRQRRSWMLTRAIAAVSASNRRALELYYMEGYRSREIADRLGIPHPTVRSRLRRGLVELQRLLPVNSTPAYAEVHDPRPSFGLPFAAAPSPPS